MSNSSHKYKLCRNDTIVIDNNTLYRIQALKSFGDVAEGEIGGYVQSYDNLSYKNNCWIYDNAKVYENAKVRSNAMITNNAIVKGNAVIYDNAKICDNVIVIDDAIVGDNASIYDNVKIYGKTKIYGNAHIMNNVVIMHNAIVKDNAYIMDNVVISNNTKIMGNTCLCGDLRIEYTNEILVLGPIGPKDDILTFINTKDSIQVVCNTNYSTDLDTFEKNVINKYQSTIYNNNYIDTINYVKQYFHKRA